MEIFRGKYISVEAELNRSRLGNKSGEAVLNGERLGHKSEEAVLNRERPSQFLGCGFGVRVIGCVGMGFGLGRSMIFLFKRKFHKMIKCY